MTPSHLDATSASAHTRSAASPTELFAIVERVATSLARRLPPQVDRDDLVGAGLLGLATAMRRFDADRAVSLASFAEHRIRGEMLDELRRMDQLSRDARSLVKRRRQVIDCRRSRGLDDGAEHVAEELGVSLPALRDIERQAAQDGTVPLDGLELPDREPDPFEQTARRELAERLTAALERLPSAQRLVLRLRYLEDLPLREIGDQLGVTASRICQIHGEALRSLRAGMDGRTGELLAA